MDEWVSSWLDEQREKGVTGLEVKKKSHKYFVYESRTYWDKGLHKKRKTSKYLGRLDREHGLVPSGEVNARITVLEYGNAVLAFHALEDLVPLLRGAFPDVWEELVASGIVVEKIAKSVELLMELSRYYEIDITAVKNACENERKTYVFTCEKSAAKGEFDMNKLLMYEGRISMIYWENLRTIFQELTPEFRFQGRKNKTYSWNMNASDEINALLNYGYAILESITRKNINTVGLDPSVGFLHELAHSKTPLVYDLQELYRWLVDLSVIQLLEEKKLGKKDFIVTENYHIRLRETAAIMLIEKIRLNFNRKAGYKGKNYAYDTIYADNTQKLANFLLGKNRELSFEIPNVKCERNDDMELREKLLKIQLKDAKKLGLNKSTLWYIQKNIREGKKIALYDRVKAKLTA